MLQIDSRTLLLPQFADLLPDVVYRLSLWPSPGLEYINPAVAVITGYAPEACYADPALILNLAHPEDRGSLQALLDGEELQFTCRMRWIAKGGDLLYMDLGGAIERDAGGRAQLLTCIARNVTAQHLREMELCRREEGLRTVLAHVPDAIARIDPALRCLYLNPVMERYLGIRAGALFAEAKGSAGTPSAGLQEWNDALGAVLATGRMLAIETTIRSVGKSLNVEIAFVPELAEEGTVRSVVVALHDMTERGRVEKALTESKDRLRLALQVTNGGAWDYDVRNSVVNTSNYWLALFGNEAGEPGPGIEAWQGTVHPDDLPLVMRAVQEHLDGLTPIYECEHRLMMRSGAYGTILSRGLVVERDSDGTPLRMVGIDIDITRFKRAENERDELFQRLTLATQIAAVGVWETDLQTELTTWNDQMFEMYGLTPQTPLPLQQWIDRIHPDDRPGILQARQQTIDASERTYEEMRILRPDGSVRYLYTIRGRLLDHAGKTTRLVGVTIDITERSQMMLAAQRLASIVDSSADAITSTDLEGRFTSWNPGAELLYGYMAREILGQPGTLLVPSEVGHEWEHNLARLRRGESIQQQETRRTAADGHLLDVAVTLSPIRGQAGEVVGIAEVTRNIGERKAMEEALRDLNEKLERRVEARTAELEAALRDLRYADQLKDEFMAAVTHELRTPLTGVLGMAEILLTQAGDSLSARQTRYLQAIHQSGERLLALVNSILGYSGLISGKVEIVPGPCHLAELCAVGVRAVTTHAEAKHQTLEFTVEPPDLTIISDAEGIIQILKKLLDNAVKFTPEEGSIGLDVGEAADHVTVTVWDTGIGIAPEKLGGIFRAFTQEQGGLARPFGGVGLGLAYVRKMVELLGGAIVVASVPGQGSRFVVTLPKVMVAP